MGLGALWRDPACLIFGSPAKRLHMNVFRCVFTPLLPGYEVDWVIVPSSPGYSLLSEVGQKIKAIVMEPCKEANCSKTDVGFDAMFI